MTSLLRSLKKRLHQEDGAIAVYLVGTLTVVLTIGFTLFVVLGDAVADRRSANTGADASALAAADSCLDHLEDEMDAARMETTAIGFWSHFGQPVRSMCADSGSVAYYYAGQNDTTLVSERFESNSLKFYTRVRSNDSVADTDAYEYSEAVSEIELESGACTLGGLFGAMVNGHCMVIPDATVSEELPPYVPTMRAHTRLTS